MRPPLPIPINRQNIEKDAPTLFHSLRRRDAVAVGRWYSLDTMAGCFQPRLADAQYVGAREYGFKSWQNPRDQLSVTSPGSVRAKLDSGAGTN
jgi:hypothetical protein